MVPGDCGVCLLMILCVMRIRNLRLSVPCSTSDPFDGCSALTCESRGTGTVNADDITWVAYTFLNTPERRHQLGKRAVSSYIEEKDNSSSLRFHIASRVLRDKSVLPRIRKLRQKNKRTIELISFASWVCSIMAALLGHQEVGACACSPLGNSFTSGDSCREVSGRAWWSAASRDRRNRVQHATRSGPFVSELWGHACRV